MSETKAEGAERPSDVEDETADFYDAVEEVESSVKALKIEEVKSEDQSMLEQGPSSEDECGQDCGACPLADPVKDENEQDDDDGESETSQNDQEEATSQKKQFVPLHETLNEEMRERKARAELADDQEVDADEIAPVPVPDQYFVDEAQMQKEEEALSVAELEERLKEAQNEKVTGNSLFKEDKFEEALEAYTRALRRCPTIFNKERAVFYSNRSICFNKMQNNERCIEECSKAIELDAQFAKPLIRRAECYQATDKLDEALEDYKRLCELEPRVASHKQSCLQLEQKIKERNEKMKEEMLGKLKDLGNMVLKPFGLSTSNFQFVQDPATGSYSVNFKK